MDIFAGKRFVEEGVIKPDLYEPQLNPVYASVLAHYRVVADPARVADPDRKGSVENAIQHTQDTALKGRRDCPSGLKGAVPVRSKAGALNLGTAAPGREASEIPKRRDSARRRTCRAK